MFEILLQMNKRPGSLNQTLKKIVIGRIFVQPDLLENVMCFVVALLVPALKIGSIKWVIGHVRICRICVCANQFRYESRNPLAFVHEEFNVVPARMRSKPAGGTEDKRERDCSRDKE